MSREQQSQHRGLRRAITMLRNPFCRMYRPRAGWTGRARRGGSRTRDMVSGIAPGIQRRMDVEKSPGAARERASQDEEKPGQEAVTKMVSSASREEQVWSGKTHPDDDLAIHAAGHKARAIWQVYKRAHWLVVLLQLAYASTGLHIPDRDGRSTFRGVARPGDRPWRSPIWRTGASSPDE